MSPEDEEHEARIAQYNRFAEDWRHISTLIWQIPTIAIAVMTGVIGVSFEFLDNLPRILLLAVGAFFLFTLCIALAKHRLFHDSRSIFIRELEQKFRVKRFPTEGAVTKAYLVERKTHTSNVLSAEGIRQPEGFTDYPIYNWFSSRRSAMWLLIVIFTAFLTVASLCFLSILDFLGVKEVNIILSPESRASKTIAHVNNLMGTDKQ